MEANTMINARIHASERPAVHGEKGAYQYPAGAESKEIGETEVAKPANATKQEANKEDVVSDCAPLTKSVAEIVKEHECNINSMKPNNQAIYEGPNEATMESHQGDIKLRSNKGHTSAVSRSCSGKTLRGTGKGRGNSNKLLQLSATEASGTTTTTPCRGSTGA